MKIWIDTNTGTWGALEGLVVLEMDALNPAQTEVLVNDWADSEINALGLAVGAPILPMLEVTGFGDLQYGNAVSYSPQALRDEAELLLEIYDNSDKELFKWAYSEATNEQLSLVGSYVLQTDDAWLNYDTLVLEGLRWAYAEAQESSKQASVK